MVGGSGRGKGKDNSLEADLGIVMGQAVVHDDQISRGSLSGVYTYSTPRLYYALNCRPVGLVISLEFSQNMHLVPHKIPFRGRP